MTWSYRLEQSQTTYQNLEIKNDIKLETLFNLAKGGNWDNVWDEIAQDLENLGNAPLSEGPDAGKTLAWEAFYQWLNERNVKAFTFCKKFIYEMVERQASINPNASPLHGPLAGASILWLLAQFIALNLDPEEEVKFQNEMKQAYLSLQKDFSQSQGLWGQASNIIIDKENLQRTMVSSNTNTQFLIFKYFEHKQNFNFSNLNAAPTKGEFKDVTVFCLMLRFKSMVHEWLNKPNQEIFGSVYSSSTNREMTDCCNVPYYLIQRIHRYAFKLLINNFGIYQLYQNDKKHYHEAKTVRFDDNKEIKSFYESILKIFENNPKWDWNFQPSKLPFDMEFYLENKNVKCPMNDWKNHGEYLLKSMWKAKNPVEMILSLPPSPNRNQLLFYLIFYGAKPTDTAIAPWKDEYKSILNEIQKISLIYHKQFTPCLGVAMPLELKHQIAYNMYLANENERVKQHAE